MMRHSVWFRGLLLGAALAAAALTPQVAAAGPGSTARVDVDHGTWVDVGPMSSKHEDADLVRLPSGRVLIMGGSGSSDCCCLRRVDMFNPRTDQWTRRAPMPRRRCSPTVRLADGRVLVAGGAGMNLTTFNTQPLRTAEIYDPRTDAWSATTPMLRRGAAAGVRLANGNALMVGSIRGGAWAEVYDPSTTRWHALASPVSPHGRLLRLRNGDVLALGWSYGRSRVCAERYLVRQHEWQATVRHHGVCSPGAAWVMPGGRVMLQTHRTRMLVYSPATNRWRWFPRVPLPERPRGLSVQGIVGVHGQPLAIASKTGCRPSGARTLAYLWRPARHRWQAWTHLRDGATGLSVGKLADGSVLIAGGVRWFRSCPIGGDHVPSYLAYRYYPDR